MQRAPRPRPAWISRYGLIPILAAPLGCTWGLCDCTPCMPVAADAEASASDPTIGSTSPTSTSATASTAGPATEGESTGSTSASTASTTQATATTTSSTSTTQTTADTATTTGPYCGDGVVDDGEACDDGNDIDTDECVAGCQKAKCGDGHVQAGVEECDPAASEGPYCDLDCKELVAVAVAAGDAHTCALLEQANDASKRSVRCWGKNLSHQLGYTDTNLTFKGQTPRAVYAAKLQSTYGNLDLDTNIAQVVAGPGKTCFILDTGLLRCTGAPHACDFPTASTDGEPNGAIDIDDAPDITFPDLYPNWSVTALSLGTKHTCATLASDKLKRIVCWQPSSQDGLNLQDDCTAKGSVCPSDPEFKPSSIQLCDEASPQHGCNHASGHGGSCYIEADGYLKCWGLNTYYAEGGQTAGVPVNLCAGPLGRKVTQVVAGPYHYCATEWNPDDALREVFCWGAGGTNNTSDGRLGPKSPGVSQTIKDSVAFCLDDGKCAVRQLALGTTFSCALSSSDELYCWGTLCEGVKWATPTKVELPPTETSISINAGSDHICASSAGFGIVCAGANLSGQTGQPSSDCSTKFEPVNL